jgi:hypothetical protein
MNCALIQLKIKNFKFYIDISLPKKISLVHIATVLKPCGLQLVYYIHSITKTGFLARGSFNDIPLMIFLW